MFNLNKNEEEETKKFWESVERETGMPVLEHALGQYIRGYEGVAGPVWGLLYLTERELYFQHFPASNWFSAILSTGGAKRDEGFSLQIPISAIESLDSQRPTTFWQRIFRPFPPTIVINYRLGDVTREIRLSVEHRRAEFEEKLRSLVSSV